MGPDLGLAAYFLLFERKGRTEIQSYWHERLAGYPGQLRQTPITLYHPYKTHSPPESALSTPTDLGQAGPAARKIKESYVHYSTVAYRVFLLGIPIDTFWASQFIWLLL